MTSQDIGHAPAGPRDGTDALPPEPAPQPRRGRRALLVVGGLVVAGAVAAASTVYVRSDDGPAAGTSAAEAPFTATAAAADVVAPVAAVVGVGADGTVGWKDPLSVAVTDGTLTDVTVTDPDGTKVPGTVGADGRWTSTGGIFPSADYQVLARARDSAGSAWTLPLVAKTAAPDKTFSVTIAPGDAQVVGTGQALSLRLSTPVKDAATRKAVEEHLAVTTVPAVAGAWRWMSSSELRYRGADFWAAGTTISVSAALSSVQAAPGVWGGPARTSTFTVGDSLTSVVDTKAHTMTVSKNGQVVRVMKASMGKPQFATRNGTFVVLEKFADRVMDSATVDLPPGTPPYKTAVKDAVRITNSGTFTHGAPWSVRSQGVSNVSHGCINLSPVDADWYYNQAKRGDVVTVVNSTTGPVLSDAGSQDWNMTFEQWKSGSALA